MQDSPDGAAVRASEVDAPAAVAPHASSSKQRRLGTDVVRGGLILGCALVACALAYLVVAVPGAWFPHATEKTWGARDLGLVRGSGRAVGQALEITAADPAGTTLVNLITDFRATDYPAIAWQVSGLAEDADVRLLWRTDVQPDKLNSTPIRVEAGRAVPTVVSGDAHWIGRITGLALALHGTLPQPIIVRGVAAEPMGVAGILRHRLHDWFTFEAWNGASINTIAGGEDYQPLPLPVLLAASVAVAALVVFALLKWRPGVFQRRAPVIVAALFLVAWALLDARWTWNLVRQERDTATRYAGKSVRDKHLANDDADLYAFVQRARDVLPADPARIFIASDADYFRGRAAYHLYPQRVYFSARGNALPPARDLHPGDWLLVYHQRGIQFDRRAGKVRWDDNQTVNAELKLVEPGAALFVIR
jgi:hypothetical protein